MKRLYRSLSHTHTHTPLPSSLSSRRSAFVRLRVFVSLSTAAHDSLASSISVPLFFSACSIAVYFLSSPPSLLHGSACRSHRSSSYRTLDFLLSLSLSGLDATRARIHIQHEEFFYLSAFSSSINLRYYIYCHKAILGTYSEISAVKAMGNQEPIRGMWRPCGGAHLSLEV